MLTHVLLMPSLFRRFGAKLDRAAWFKACDAANLEALQCRLAQDPLFRRVLVATHQQKIFLLHVDRSGAKSYWGGSVSKTTGEVVGQNKLGYTLMDLAATAAGAALHEEGGAVPKPHGNAAVHDGGRAAKRMRLDGGGTSDNTCSSANAGGGGGGAKAAASTPAHSAAAAVDYVGFYKKKVPNADRKFKSFCNLHPSPYVVPDDGTGTATSLLPMIRGKRFQTVEGGFQLLKFNPVSRRECATVHLRGLREISPECARDLRTSMLMSFVNSKI